MLKHVSYRSSSTSLSRSYDTPYLAGSTHSTSYYSYQEHSTPLTPYRGGFCPGPHLDNISMSSAISLASLNKFSLGAASNLSLCEMATVPVKVHLRRLHPDMEYKTVLLTLQTTCKQLIYHLLNKFRLKHRDPNLFYVQMEIAVRSPVDGAPVNSKLVLEDGARPAELQQCRPKGEANFSIGVKRGGLLKIHDSIIMAGSHYKSLLISYNTSADEVVQLLLNCYNSKESPKHYSLHEVCRMASIDKKVPPKACPVRLQAAWPCETRPFWSFVLKRNVSYTLSLKSKLQWRRSLDQSSTDTEPDAEEHDLSRVSMHSHSSFMSHSSSLSSSSGVSSDSSGSSIGIGPSHSSVISNYSSGFSSDSSRAVESPKLKSPESLRNILCQGFFKKSTDGSRSNNHDDRKIFSKKTTITQIDEDIVDGNHIFLSALKNIDDTDKYRVKYENVSPLRKIDGPLFSSTPYKHRKVCRGVTYPKKIPKPIPRRLFSQKLRVPNEAIDEGLGSEINEKQPEYVNIFSVKSEKLNTKSFHKSLSDLDAKITADNKSYLLDLKRNYNSLPVTKPQKHYVDLSELYKYKKEIDNSVQIMNNVNSLSSYNSKNNVALGNFKYLTDTVSAEVKCVNSNNERFNTLNDGSSHLNKEYTFNNHKIMADDSKVVVNTNYSLNQNFAKTDKETSNDSKLSTTSEGNKGSSQTSEIVTLEKELPYNLIEELSNVKISNNEDNNSINEIYVKPVLFSILHSPSQVESNVKMSSSILPPESNVKMSLPFAPSKFNVNMSLSISPFDSNTTVSSITPTEFNVSSISPHESYVSAISLPYSNVNASSNTIPETNINMSSVSLSLRNANMSSTTTLSTESGININSILPHDSNANANSISSPESNLNMNSSTLPPTVSNLNVSSILLPESNIKVKSAITNPVQSNTNTAHSFVANIEATSVNEVLEVTPNKGTLSEDCKNTSENKLPNNNSTKDSKEENKTNSKFLMYKNLFYQNSLPRYFARTPYNYTPVIKNAFRKDGILKSVPAKRELKFASIKTLSKSMGSLNGEVENLNDSKNVKNNLNEATQTLENLEEEIFKPESSKVKKSTSDLSTYVCTCKLCFYI